VSSVEPCLETKDNFEKPTRKKKFKV